ncbi:MAG: hypothetical protein AB7O52_18640 [Planctomycetota bacterium]
MTFSGEAALPLGLVEEFDFHEEGDILWDCPLGRSVRLLPKRDVVGAARYQQLRRGSARSPATSNFWVLSDRDRDRHGT